MQVRAGCGEEPKGKTPNPIPLEQLEEPNSIYEPEQFPAAIVKSNEPKVTYLIFNSGKIIISGVKTDEELEKAAEAVTRIAVRAERESQDKTSLQPPTKHI